MLQDMVHPPEHLHIDEITSPFNAQIFDFCESELFPETLQNSEVASNSNCCYEEHSSYPTNLSLTSDMNNYSSSIDKFDTTNLATTTLTSTAPAATSITAISSTLTPNNNGNTTTNNNNDNNNCNLSLIFDSPEDIENDISASIDFSPSTNFTVPQFLNTQQEQFDLSSLNNQLQVADIGDGSLQQYNLSPPGGPLMAPPLPPVYEDECLSTVPSYMRMTSSTPSCPLFDPTLGSYLPAALSVENPGILTGGGLFLGPELPCQDLDFQGDNGGLFCPMQRVYNCTTDLQALNNESQHLIKGRGSSTPLTSEITSLDDSTFKVGKLSVEERKEKIHRYMKKRNERNFSKKIKYACRKTLADSRPRVRGRFAKNEELAEAARAAMLQHEEDTDDDCQRIGVVKEEEDLIDSSDIFAHISGVNSFKINNPMNPIQSWI